LPKLGGAVRIEIARPILPERYTSRHDDHLVLREMIDEVMFEIRAITGQEYRNVYATRQAEALPTDVARPGRLEADANIPRS
jgi:1-acyl-sn-glycerol-3-phosphate acyltransferase